MLANKINIVMSVSGPHFEVSQTVNKSLACHNAEDGNITEILQHITHSLINLDQSRHTALRLLLLKG